MNAEQLDSYDAGLLNDFGGGNVGWWQDYIRAELERAHEHYKVQVDALFEGKVLVPVDVASQVEKALNRAFNMGQTYWQQADSDYRSQHKLSDTTKAQYERLKGDTIAMLAASQEQGQ